MIRQQNMAMLKNNYEKRRESILNLSSIQHALASEISSQLLTNREKIIVDEQPKTKFKRKIQVNNSVTVEIEDQVEDEDNSLYYQDT